MQTNCPQCSQVLSVDDAKVPAGPFLLTCPKCQTALKLPGKGKAPSAVSAAPSTNPGPGGAAAKPNGAPTAVPRPPSAAVAPPPPSQPQEPKPTGPAPAPQAGGGGAALSQPSRGVSDRALISLPDNDARNSVAAALRRIGFDVELVSPEESIRRLERDVFSMVVTWRNGDAGSQTGSVYKRIAALAPEVRRNTFLVLVGDEFATGDGIQAFAAMADLVIHPKDSGASDELLQNTLFEKQRIYQGFLEALTRWHDSE